MPETFDRDWAFATEARKLRDEGQYDKAIELFTCLIDRYNISELFFERGTTCSRQGHFEKAIMDLTQAIALKNDDPDSYMNRGNAYLKQGQFAAAIDDYDRALQLSPQLACAYNSRAYAWQRTGRVDDAINGYLHAMQLDKSYASPCFNLGTLLLEIGRFNDALGYLQMANKLLPNDTAVMSALNEVHSKLGITAEHNHGPADSEGNLSPTVK